MVIFLKSLELIGTYYIYILSSQFFSMLLCFVSFL